MQTGLHWRFAEEQGGRRVGNAVRRPFAEDVRRRCKTEDAGYEADLETRLLRYFCKWN